MNDYFEHCTRAELRTILRGDPRTDSEDIRDAGIELHRRQAEDRADRLRRQAMKPEMAEPALECRKSRQSRPGPETGRGAE